MKVRNIHTNEVREVANVENLSDRVTAIKVYELDDGQRWNAQLFAEHWREEVDAPCAPLSDVEVER
jgi:hypothetical protein